MADLTSGASAKIQLDPGQSLRVEAEGGTTNVTSLYGAPAGTTAVTGSTVFGPYSVPAMLRVACASGAASYATVRDEPAANALTAPQVTALQAVVSGDGIRINLTDDAAENTAAIKAALLVPTVVSLVGRSDAPYTINETLEIGDGVTLDLGGVTLRAKNGLNADLLRTVGFAALTGTTSSGGPAHFAIRNGRLNGNHQNQTSGYPLRIFGKAYELENLAVENGKSGAIWSEWGSAGGRDMEASWINVRASNSLGDHLITWAGPHDSQWLNVIGYIDDIEFDGMKTLVYQPQNTPGFFHCTNAHFWGGVDRAVDVQSSSIFVNCMAEGAKLAQLRFRSNFGQWIGGSLFQANVSGSCGVEFGEAGVTSAKGCYVVSRFTDFNAGAVAVKFTNSGGHNIVVGQMGGGTSAVTNLIGGSPVNTIGSEDRIDIRFAEQPAKAASWQVPKVQASRLVIPCTQFAATSGTPAIGNITQGAVLLFDANAAEIAATAITLPEWWGTASILLHWANTSASAGDVKWTVRTSVIAAGSTLNGTMTSNFKAAVAAGAQNVTVTQTQDGVVTNVPGSPIAIRVERDATNAADTLAADAALIAIELVRLT